MCCECQLTAVARPDRGWLSPSNPSAQEPSAEAAARTNSGIGWALMWGLTDPFETGRLRLPEKNPCGTLCTDPHTRGAWGLDFGWEPPLLNTIKICHELQILFT